MSFRQALGTDLIRRHGGPGGGVATTDTVYFDPEVYRIVLFDQRGAGKSEPSVSALLSQDKIYTESTVLLI
jgi:pimeloyl-ACP methyl ester carboxylesterase